ncbi:formate dehydrogenase subunit delta [Aquabacterium sp.]|uniref:formate dehydrogenase subunit delta n=1 Tax=Aquabacterium sp. TaxID=1872578 RepID=UPI003BB1A175
MDINNLIGMANRIGDFFESMPNRQEAKADIALHISKFWEPRMREALIARLDDPTSLELHALVKEAVKENLAMLATKATHVSRASA